MPELENKLAAPEGCAPLTCWAFLEAWIAEKGTANCLDAELVVAVIERFEWPHIRQFYGAPKCPMLGRELAAMHRAGKVSRSRIGLHNAESGFPKWVFVYSPNN